MIDADYRGPVMVLLYNLSDTDFSGELMPSYLRKAQLTGSSETGGPDRSAHSGTNHHGANSGSRREFP